MDANMVLSSVLVVCVYRFWPIMAFTVEDGTGKWFARVPSHRSKSVTYGTPRYHRCGMQLVCRRDGRWRNLCLPPMPATPGQDGYQECQHHEEV